MQKTKPAPPKPAPAKSKYFTPLIMLIGLAGAAVIAYLLTKPAAPTVITVDPNAPLPAAQGYVTGSASAPVEVTMFGDFECPACGRFAVITEPDVRSRLVATGAMRFKFVDFLIPSHQNAPIAHNAAACANAQGKFWEMHDLLFQQQPNWSALLNGKDSRNPVATMKRYAKDLGLDVNAFNTCLDSRQFEAQIRANHAEGVKLGVPGTPTFFVGNRMIYDVLTYDAIKTLVDSATAAAKKPPPQ